MTKASKARVEKQTAAKAQGVQHPPDTQPPPKPTAGQGPVSEDEIQAAQAYVNELLQGKVKLTNDLAKELLQQLRQAEQALAQVVPRIEQLQQTLAQLRERRTALSAVSQNIGLNLYRWRAKTTKGD